MAKKKTRPGKPAKPIQQIFIRSVIVDDVAMVRVTIKRLLLGFPNIEVVGEAGDYEDALSIINETNPDLVFLDIDLNGISSIDLLNEINCNPKIIFITSHAEFALKAFELNAVDFIMKPVNNDRMQRAISRVTQFMESREDSVETLPEDNGRRLKADQLILLTQDNRMSFYRVEEISYIEAYGNYTRLYLTDEKSSTTYNSIKGWEIRLPTDVFMQIHRSTIVNLKQVIKIEKWNNDTGRLFLKGQEKPFEISRSYFFLIKKKFKV